MNEEQEPDYNTYITYDDPRYPTLVVQVNGKYAGYSLNTETLELSRVCICFAHNSNECCCGALDLNDQ
jgi:hypothetical protein